MTLTCAADGVEYSVGAPACPQCGATRRYETGSPEHLAAIEAAAKPRKGGRASESRSASGAEGAE